MAETTFGSLWLWLIEIGEFLLGLGETIYDFMDWGIIIGETEFTIGAILFSSAIVYWIIFKMFL